MAGLRYGFETRLVGSTFEQAIEKMTSALKEQGFGVLMEIDVQDTLKKKLGVDFRRYVILGACNPHLAYEALGLEINLGTLLPCNVVVYTRDDGKTAVMIMDPVAALSMIGNPEMTELAKKVTGKMERVLAAL